MVRKRTGRVQFLVLLRLWTGPPQNNNNNKRNRHKAFQNRVKGTFVGKLKLLCYVLVWRERVRWSAHMLSVSRLTDLTEQRNISLVSSFLSYHEPHIHNMVS